MAIRKSKMISKIILLQFILLTIIGCKQREHKKEIVSNGQIGKIQSENFPDHLKNWAKDINSHNAIPIQNYYDRDAIKIIYTDSIIEHSTLIANYYTFHKGKITSIESIFSIEANKEKRINYELVSYKTDDHKEFIGLVIWRMENEKIIREFEFTEESSIESGKVDTTKISERRKLWMELCNAHNVKALVEQLYSNNTIYYNHKPIVKGTEKLVKEYSYMNNKNYRLTLQPIIVKVVNDNLAFEVGQCSGGYNGKYILIWNKQADGNWKIYIDSNI
jgi:ketosteroid isomerase-like protein